MCQMQKRGSSSLVEDPEAHDGTMVGLMVERFDLGLGGATFDVYGK